MKSSSDAIKEARKAANKIRKLKLELERKITVVHQQKIGDLELRIIHKLAGHRLQSRNFAGGWTDETNLGTRAEINDELRKLIRNETPARQLKRKAARASWQKRQKK